MADSTTPQPPANSGRGLGMPPEATASEMAILGCVLSVAQVDTAQAAKLLTATPDPADYYGQQHETIAAHLAAISRNGMALDPAGVLEHIRADGDLKPGTLDGPYLHRLMEHSCPPSSVDWHTDQIERAARRRRAQRAIQRAGQQLENYDADDTLDVLVDAADALDTAVQEEVHGARHTTITVETIDEVLGDDDEDEEYDWLIPGLLERQDRLIVTGPEGGGKSTLLRQLAIQAAMGLHPFTGEMHRPLRVLYVDCENSRRQFRRKARGLRIQAGEQLEADMLHMSFRTEGLDLTTRDDVSWLERHVAHTRPDLLITGPIYKLANGDPLEEKSAKPVAMALDKIRAHHQCGVILEAHAPKALGGSKKRAHEPYGWSGWLRWPEFGIWLDKEGEIEHWRGMRDERNWPELLQRGGDWPWTVATSENAIRWTRIRDEMKAANEILTIREISDRTGIARTTVGRVLGEFSMQFEALKAQIGVDDDEQ